jgi:hypothetical protein
MVRIQFVIFRQAAPRAIGCPAVGGAGLKIKISRADVADFMLRQLHEPTYLRQAASLSY